MEKLIKEKKGIKLFLDTQVGSARISMTEGDNELIIDLHDDELENFRSALANVSTSGKDFPSDSEMIDFLQSLMTNDDDYCEVYLSGLRNWTGRATEFQLETNPQKIEILNKSTLRGAIAMAIKIYNKNI